MMATFDFDESDIMPDLAALTLPVDYTLIEPPVYRSGLYMTGGVDQQNTQFQFTAPMPNPWFRLWQRLLLGWRWENLDDH